MIEQYLNTITQGDCLDLTKKLPDASINCTITSPPYWGLRDYSTGGKVWGGDESCEHEWNTVKKKWHSDRGNSKRKEVFDDSFQVEGTPSSFCVKCEAWRGELGLEPTFELYLEHLWEIFDEVKRVLRDDGTCWVNLGDTYGTHTSKRSGQFGSDISSDINSVFTKSRKSQSVSEKSLCIIPQRFAIGMLERGWILRNTIIWHKPNCMPSSAKDRFTVDFEYVYFFVKSKKYAFETQYEPVKESTIARYQYPNSSGNQKIEYGDSDKINRINPRIERQGHKEKLIEQGRIKRTVWTINTKPFKEAHFAVFPEALVETPIKAGCPEGGVVLDPFSGAGTVAKVATELNRNFIGFELNPEYCEIARRRLKHIQKEMI